MLLLYSFIIHFCIYVIFPFRKWNRFNSIYMKDTTFMISLNLVIKVF